MKQTCLLILLIFTGCLAGAKNYYVRTDGKNSNPGTSNMPAGAWLTIASKLSVLKPGDTLFIENGTYIEDEIKITNKLGSNTNRVVIKAINPHGAKISSKSAWSAININKSTGITLENLEVFFPAGSNNKEYCILAEESNFITVKGCLVYNAGCSGIQLNTSDNLVVENNIAKDCASRNEYNGSGISVGFLKEKSNSGWEYAVTIRNNICTNNNCDIAFTPGGQNVPTDGNGIICDLWTQNGYTKKGLIENNLCYNNGGKGIQVLHSNNVTVLNNTVWHNNTILKKYHYSGEITLSGTNNRVINNISVAEPAFSQISSLKIFDDNKTTVIKNNILVAPNPGRQFDCYTGTTLTSNGNSGTMTSSNDVYPKFVNPVADFSSSNFHLQGSSPAVNKGINNPSPLLDLDGNKRPAGGAVDIGCYEFIDSTQTSIFQNQQIPNTSGSIFRMYPNPANEYVRILFLNSPASGTIQLYNCQNKMIYQTQTDSSNELVINSSGIESGMYIVMLKQENKSYSEKLIIN